MKGIILSGGLGTRLRPLTYVTHKHLLPVYDKVMVELPLGTLISAGINDIMVVSGEENLDQYEKFLGNGKRYECSIAYGIQKEAGGISQAIRIARDFAKGKKIVVILGDNYFEENMKKYVDEFANMKKGAMIIFNEIDDIDRLKRLGVAKLDRNNKLVEVIEKPQDPPSHLAQTGLYMYDERVFDFIDRLKPSDRGELEVTDLNNLYIQENTLKYRVTKQKWLDMGTFDTLLEASILLKIKKKTNRRLLRVD